MSTLLSPQQRRDLSILGIEASRLPTQDTIRKAYRARALALHPDMPTGDSQAFIALQGAYENLTSPPTSSSSSQQRKPQATTTSTSAAAASASASSSPRPQRATSAGASYNSSNHRRNSTATSASAAAAGAGSPRQPFSESLRGGAAKTTTTFNSGSSPPRRNSGGASPLFGATTSSNSSTGSNSYCSAFAASPSPSSSCYVAPPPPPLRQIYAPFPAFLAGGVPYQFETNPNCFGSYSRHVVHGDTARIDNGNGGGAQSQFGVVVGVAGDNNLYWWKLNSVDGTLDSEATVLAPKVQTPNSPKFVVVRGHKSSAAAAAASSSSCSSSADTTPVRPAAFQQQEQQSMNATTTTPVRAPSGLSDIDDPVADLTALECEGRKRVELLRSQWLSEAWWCINYSTFAVADSVRYSRTIMR